MPFDVPALYSAAVRAAHPDALLPAQVRALGGRLLLAGEEIGLGPDGRVRILGFGKAAAAMAQATEGLLGGLCADGLVIAKEGSPGSPERIEVLYGDHPVPSQANLAHSRRLARFAEECGPEDLAIVLVSGGGSALLTMPREGVSLSDLRRLNELLISRDVPIAEINVLRKHLSAVKGGQLSRWLAPARVRTLILSDVPGNDASAIASGPTVPDASTFADAWEIIESRGLLAEAPKTILDTLQAGCEGLYPETPDETSPLFANSRTTVIGNLGVALQGAKQSALEQGFTTFVESKAVVGNVRDEAKALLEGFRLLRGLHPQERKLCLIAGGETTVSLTGDGKGGRNQEFVLACLALLGEQEAVTVFSFGTDGEDGPTDAAGAWGSLRTRRAAEAEGDSLGAYLNRNDSYRFFERYGGLLKPGPSGTNVGDVMGFIVDATARGS